MPSSILGFFISAAKGSPKTTSRLSSGSRAPQNKTSPKQHNLATVYAEGKGIATSYPKAAAWFGKSAEAGLSQSQFSLGALH